MLLSNSRQIYLAIFHFFYNIIAKVIFLDWYLARPHSPTSDLKSMFVTEKSLTLLPLVIDYRSRGIAIFLIKYNDAVYRTLSWDRYKWRPFVNYCLGFYTIPLNFLRSFWWSVWFSAKFYTNSISSSSLFNIHLREFTKFNKKKTINYSKLFYRTTHCKL